MSEVNSRDYLLGRELMSGGDGRRGSRCMRLGVPTASRITAFAVCCCRAEGLLQPLASALA
jgi:hypothetical protein